MDIMFGVYPAASGTALVTDRPSWYSLWCHQLCKESEVRYALQPDSKDLPCPYRFGELLHDRPAGRADGRHELRQHADRRRPAPGHGHRGAGLTRAGPWPR